MIEFISAFIGVFIVSWMLTPLSAKVGLVDKPVGRKQHKGDIPLIGGLAMFASCSVAALFFVPHSSEMTYLLAACGMLVMTGSIDDRFDLHYYIRLGVQALATAMLIWGANTQLTSFGNLFGFGEIQLGWLSIPVTFIAVIGMINAFNMIDGIDGLSGGLTLISAIGLYFLIGDKISDGAQNILLLLMGALTAYLILNVHIFPKWTTKIFMGDAGSMVLGFVITSFLIRYSQESKEIMMPVTALWIAAIPLLDILVTTIRRVRHGKNPFHPDRTHVHHIFLRAGFSKATTLTILLVIQTLFICIGVMLQRNAPPLGSLLVFLVFFTGYLNAIGHAFKLAKYLRKTKKRKNTL
ncbi:undecaprenyl-phosphate alpha-N-acetylglucosaminyl 1-phosphate transferase [Reinekea blandensis]|uniref:Undecaprenyl-phosphate alpha-N-acetylglucosaminyl 1-phosphate transferase n=1 Tax=Reinekea blandensis MED297 TaxID=314283 RepID=A4BIW7_9GAMM|nr:undecaprenyl-phosphate alpha-N-acetylglucosaminyl 1-phosphate transferase [Reinekea blandensis]EAR07900.1 undecaprenyl-phosphate alpha-N-acetylglucosaminyl 1-phosphate transferase [Reinekea sp. MED297] [Reinekea blandensis MED297]